MPLTVLFLCAVFWEASWLTRLLAVQFLNAQIFLNIFGKFSAKIKGLVCVFGAMNRKSEKTSKR